MEMNEMTQYLMLVASSIDNYCKYLKKDFNEYAGVLGYVYRAHQDKIRKLSPQGIGLLMLYLKDVPEEVKSKIKFHLVENYSEIYNAIFKK